MAIRKTTPCYLFFSSASARVPKRLITNIILELLSWIIQLGSKVSFSVVTENEIRKDFVRKAILEGFDPGFIVQLLLEVKIYVGSNAAYLKDGAREWIPGSDWLGEKALRQARGHILLRGLDKVDATMAGTRGREFKSSCMYALIQNSAETRKSRKTDHLRIELKKMNKKLSLTI